MSTPKKKNENKKNILFNKNYQIWFWSQIILSLLIGIIALIFSINFYFKILSLLNQSNKLIVNKTNSEIIKEIDIKNLEKAKIIIDKKNNTYNYPDTFRNIFNYNGYIMFKNNKNSTSSEEINIELDEVNLNKEEIIEETKN